jgi:hypothetical protein
LEGKNAIIKGVLVHHSEKKRVRSDIAEASSHPDLSLGHSWASHGSTLLNEVEGTEEARLANFFQSQIK